MNIEKYDKCFKEIFGDNSELHPHDLQVIMNLKSIGNTSFRPYSTIEESETQQPIPRRRNDPLFFSLDYFLSYFSEWKLKNVRIFLLTFRENNV